MTTTKIFIIFAIICLVLFLIQRYPRHGLVKLSLLHIGPVPREIESERSYLIRWSLFVWKWGILFFLLIIIANYFAPRYIVEHSGLFIGIFLFGLPVLFGMCVLGGLYTFVLSLRPSSKKKLCYDENVDNRDHYPQ